MRLHQPSDVYAMIVETNIKSDINLCTHALKLKEKENNPLIFNCVFKKDKKRQNYAIHTAWNMKPTTVERWNKSRSAILEEVRNVSCKEDCAGRQLLQTKTACN